MPNGSSSALSFRNHFILPPAKDIRYHPSPIVIDRMPQPALVVLLPHIGPHLIDFCFINPLDDHVHIVRMQRVEEQLVYRGERRLFFSKC